MARFLKKKTASLGQPPGELVFIGEQKVEATTIRVIDYDQEKLSEQDLLDIKACLPYKEAATVTWINISGLHDTNLIKEIGNDFGLHPLVLEDIVNTGQRPKMEEYDDYLFFVIKMIRYDPAEQKLKNEQLSMVLGDTFPLTFIAGIYGTNFEYLPELHFRYAYFVFWGVLLTVALIMIKFFKRRNWL